MMRVVGIIQARMGSRRLPGKVMMQLGPKTVIEHVVGRLKQAKTIDEVVVATTDGAKDEVIITWCLDNEVLFYRGSENDVLDRYYQAAIKFDADVIVRITADCPMIDPEIVDIIVEGFLSGDFDGYGLSGEYPDGLDCQVFKFSALKQAWTEAILASDREHVGSYIENTNPKSFKLGSMSVLKQLGHHRWTLDEPEDYEFLRLLVSDLCKKNENFRTQDVLDHLDENPKLLSINSNIVRNQSYKNMRENEENI